MALTKVITGVTDLNQNSSTNGLKFPTGSVFAGTPEEGMIRNDQSQSSETSSSTMQFYNGTAWKNFVNKSSIPLGSDNFNSVLYTGSGGSQNIDTVGFQPDFTWIKQRNDTNPHSIFDSVRGAGKLLSSQNTNAESGNAGDLLGSFRPLGFQVNRTYLSSNFDNTNLSGATYVAWSWKAGGAAVSNTDGSITSQVSANVDTGFSIVSYTGASGTVGHGLDSTPEIIIQKKTNGSEDWYVYFPPGVIDSNYNYMVLNSTAGKGTTGSTPPTTTTFNPVSSSGNYIAYAWHSVAGYSKIGPYTGNGSATGPVVDTGFEPAWVMIKSSSSNDGGGGAWLIYDNKRSTSNPRNKRLYPNYNYAELTSSSYDLDFLSNGFQPKSGASSYGFNTSGVEYIYMAFAAT